MFKRLLSFIVPLLIGCSLPAHIASQNEIIRYYPIGKDGSWGYAAENGVMKIPYQFEKADFFIGGTAVVKYHGAYGLINENGEFIVKANYDNIENAGSYFKATKNKKTRLLDRKGKKIPKNTTTDLYHCGHINDYSDPLAYFDKTRDQFVLNDEQLSNQQRLDPAANLTAEDFTFDELIPFSDQSLIVRKENQFNIYIHYNYVGLHSHWYDEIIPDYFNFRGQEKQYEASRARVKNNGLWGLISKRGHILLEPEFLSIDRSNGIFYLVEYKPEHFGYITTSNKRFF